MAVLLDSKGNSTTVKIKPSESFTQSQSDTIPILFCPEIYGSSIKKLKGID